MASGSTGGSRWSLPTQTLVRAVIDGAARGTQRLILEAQIEVKNKLSKAGTGKKHRGLRYTSSAPGQPPAVQTGTLRRSWQTGTVRTVASGTRLGWRLGSNLRYARRLEFGGGFIAPRPYLRPAIDKIRPRVDRVMKAYIGQALRRAMGATK